MLLIFLDPGIRRDDDGEINQSFLKGTSDQSVIPAQAGIHVVELLDPGLRRDDE